MFDKDGRGEKPPPPACDGAHLDPSRIGLLRGTLTEGSMTLEDGPVLATGDGVMAVQGLAETAQGTVVGGSDGFWLVRDGDARFFEAPGDGDGQSFFVADLDADGNEDLAVQSRNGQSRVTAWRTIPDGYERGSAFVTGFNVELFAVGDIDGDGASDVASFVEAELLAQRNDHELGFEQTLNGTFLPDSFAHSVPAGGELVDVNGGALDAVAIYTDETDGVTGLFAQVFTGDGAGRFVASTHTIMRSPWTGTVRSARFGDVSGDGIVDAVISVEESSGANTVLVALGRGFGGFGELQPVFSDQAPISAQLIDPDGDGTSDIACLRSAGPGFATLTVLRSLGSFEFELEDHAVPIGDVRGFAARADGTFDLLVALGCELPCDEQCEGRCVLDACMQ